MEIWQDIYVQLLAYTTGMLESKCWFRKGGDGYLKGKEPHDYVMDAIRSYLEHPEKFDTATGRPLLNYLKYHIIQTFVSNDVRSSENKRSSDIFAYADGKDNDDEPFLYIEAFLPFAQATFDESLDCDRIFGDIREQIKEDDVVSKIFEGVCFNQLLRRDVIAIHDMPAKEFDNGMKRLNRVLEKTARKYQLG